MSEAVAIAKLEEAFRAHDKHDEERFGRIEGHTSQIPAMAESMRSMSGHQAQQSKDTRELFREIRKLGATDATHTAELASVRAKAISTGLTTKQKLGAWAAIIAAAATLVGALVAGFDAFRTTLGK